MFHNKEEIKILHNRIDDLRHTNSCQYSEINELHEKIHDLRKRTARQSDILYSLLNYLGVEYVEEHINEIRKKKRARKDSSG